ncbi:MAG: hypothetical protein H0X13_06885 [Ramlibacter sp.]|nr:hypothetical protein [Ramlibacter sp.]
MRFQKGLQRCSPFLFRMTLLMFGTQHVPGVVAAIEAVFSFLTSRRPGHFFVSGLKGFRTRPAA